MANAEIQFSGGTGGESSNWSRIYTNPPPAYGFRGGRHTD